DRQQALHRIDEDRDRALVEQRLALTGVARLHRRDLVGGDGLAPSGGQVTALAVTEVVDQRGRAEDVRVAQRRERDAEELVGWRLGAELRRRQREAERGRGRRVEGGKVDVLPAGAIE